MRASVVRNSPQQVIRFTRRHALIIGSIAVFVGVVASLLDAGDNIYFFNRILMFINPDGNAFYQGAVDFIAVIAAGGVYVFVNYAFLRAGGYHKTIDKQQRNTGLHGQDAEEPEDDDIISFFGNLTSAAGLCSMALMVITNIIGLFILEWPGIYEHGASHTDRFIVAFVVNLVAAIFFFAMATLGMILGFHFLEYAGIRARRDARAQRSAGKAMPTQQGQSQSQSQQSQIQQRQPQPQLPNATNGRGTQAQMIPQRTSATHGRQQAQQFTRSGKGSQQVPIPQHARRLDLQEHPTMPTRQHQPVPVHQQPSRNTEDEYDPDDDW